MGIALYIWAALLVGFLLGVFWASATSFDDDETCGCGDEACEGLHGSK